MSKFDGNSRLAVFTVALVILIAAPLAVIGADRFRDVPDSNVFHDDISWLADADVTRGCNPPTNDQFCPSDNVTREQMAAFMHRLAENRVVDAATAERADVALNAQKLEGKAVVEISPVVFGGGGSGGLADNETVVLADASTTVETDGFAVLNYGLGAAYSFGSVGDVYVWLQVDASTCESGSAVPGSRTQATVAQDGVEPYFSSIAKSTIIALDAGTHTVTLCADVDGSADLRYPSVTGIFSPRGETSLATAFESVSRAPGR